MVLLLPIPQIQMLYTPHPETHTQCKTITGCVNVQFTQPYSYSNGKLNSVVFWTLLWHQKWINVIKTDINTQTTIWGNHHVTFQSYCFCFLLSNKIHPTPDPQSWMSINYYVLSTHSEEDTDHYNLYEHLYDLCHSKTNFLTIIIHDLLQIYIHVHGSQSQNITVPTIHNSKADDNDFTFATQEEVKIQIKCSELCWIQYTDGKISSFMK